MKFLPLELATPHIIPINITYYNPKDFSESDVLTITFKNQDSGEHIVYDIKDPEIEIYIE